MQAVYRFAPPIGTRENARPARLPRAARQALAWGDMGTRSRAPARARPRRHPSVDMLQKFGCGRRPKRVQHPHTPKNAENRCVVLYGPGCTDDVAEMHIMDNTEILVAAVTINDSKRTRMRRWLERDLYTVTTRRQLMNIWRNACARRPERD